MNSKQSTRWMIAGFAFQMTIALLAWWGCGLNLERQVGRISTELQKPGDGGAGIVWVDPRVVALDQVRWSAQTQLLLLGGVLIACSAATTWLMIRRVRIQLEAEAKTSKSERSVDRCYVSDIERKLEARNALIQGLAKFVESRGKEAGNHLNRIANYVLLLSEELKSQGYPFDDDSIQDITLASTLHDIGMIRIPESILLKPGDLTRTEREAINQHSSLGEECIATIRRDCRQDTLLELAQQIVAHHHERWDGMGYPDGLVGESIPLAARIVTLADVYDALTTERPYKRAMSHNHAMEIIKDQAGRQFDPNIVDAFVARGDEFMKIKQNYGIAEPDGPQDEAALLEKLLAACSEDSPAPSEKQTTVS